MKRSALVLALVLVGTDAGAQGTPDASSQGGYFSPATSFSTGRLEKAQKAYLDCLECQNEGVIESAIAHVVWMKLNAPAQEFSTLREKLDRLTVGGKTPEIRYQAYLATLVFDHPATFQEVTTSPMNGPNELFVSLSRTLQKRLMGYGDRKYVRPW